MEVKSTDKVEEDRIKEAETETMKHFKANRKTKEKKLSKEFGTDVKIKTIDIGSIILNLDLKDGGVIKYIAFLSKSGILSNIFQYMITQELRDKCGLEDMSITASLLPSESGNIEQLTAKLNTN